MHWTWMPAMSQWMRSCAHYYTTTRMQWTWRLLWADLSQDDVAAAATSLMVGLEENAFLLADAVTTEKIIIKPTTNICK